MSAKLWRIPLMLSAVLVLSACGGGTPDPAPDAPQPGYRASLYDTIWPVDMANSNRSNTVVDAGLPRDLAGVELVVETVPMAFPVFAYTRDPDEIFVVGGIPNILAGFVAEIDGLPQGSTPLQPHLTKFNPLTGAQTTLPLDEGSGFPYIGGALVHANGYVYVVSQAHLYKVDAEAMVIEKSIDLPVPDGPLGFTSIYNGLAASRSGALLTKSFSFGGDTSSFLIIDPDTLEFLEQLDHPGASPRLTVSPQGEQEFLYHLDQSNTFRFAIGESSLDLDETWISPYDPYATGSGENPEPTSPVIANGRVYYTTNTQTSATEPMMLMWQDSGGTYTTDSPPLAGELMFPGDTDAGWNFFHLSIDDAVSGIIIGMDQANGRIGAFRIDDQDRLEYLWDKQLRVSARPAIVADRGLVYATDYTDGHNHLVVLDLQTGTELARVATPATRATISTIIVGMNDDVYFGSNEPGQDTGLFHRIRIAD